MSGFVLALCLQTHAYKVNTYM